MVGSHLLPPNLLRLFAPRPPLPFLKPVGRDPDVPLKSLARKPPTLGVYDTLRLVKEEQQEAENRAFEKGEILGAEEEEEDKKKVIKGETKEEQKENKQEDSKEEGEATEPTKASKKPVKPEDDLITTLPVNERAKARQDLKKKKHENNLAEGIKSYNPAEDEEAVGDPYKTLFVARLPYELTESDLRREFEIYGSLERIRLVRNKDGKSRGYAFLVYERERDMKAAYKDAEGLKLMNKRLLIDVERGRTVKGWKPRRLGGGLGGRPKKAVFVPEPAFAGPPMRGGFGGRGGGRGGFVQRGGGFGGRGGFGGGGDRGGFGGGGGGGGFRGGFNDRGGFGGPPRGGFGGDRGGFGGPPGGGFGGPPPARGGFGGPPGGGYGGDRGGFGGGQQRGGYGGPPGGGFQGQSGPDSGYGNRGGPPMGGGPPGGFGGGEKRPFDQGAGGGGGYGDDKRPRY